MSKTDSKPTIISSVKKALLILDTFLEQQRPLGVTEISGLLGISFPTTHHLMSTLKAGGYLAQDNNDKKYKLGIKSFQLGLVAQNFFHGLVERANLILEDLAKKINEDCNLVIIEGHEIVYIAKASSSHVMRFSPKLGARGSLFHTAAGKIFLAFGKYEQAHKDFEKYYPDVDWNIFSEELSNIKKQGFAIYKEEHEEGSASIAVPVRNFTGDVCAVLSVSGLATRIAQNETYILDETTKYARKLSADLGYTKWSSSLIQNKKKAIISKSPIGILDTGVGGLAVVKQMLKQMPHESILYFGDTERSPYGPRPLSEIKKFVLEGCGFLINGGAKVLLITCTSSSVAGEMAVRKTYPNVPIIGMVEAGVKATLGTTKNKVAIFGTKATIESKIFEEYFRQINPRVVLVPIQTENLLHMAGLGGERGGFSREAMLSLAKSAFDLAINEGADSILLASSDFPCISHIIEEASNNRVNIIDPIPIAVAEMEKLLVGKGIATDDSHSPIHEYFVSGYDNELFEKIGQEFLGTEVSVQKVTFSRIDYRDIQ